MLVLLEDVETPPHCPSLPLQQELSHIQLVNLFSNKTCAQPYFTEARMAIEKGVLFLFIYLFLVEWQ